MLPLSERVLKVVYAVCFSLDLELLEDDPDLEVAVFQS